MTAHTRIYGDNQLPTYPQNDCQDERFTDTLEHRAAMAARALTNAAKVLFEISQTTEGRDALIEELTQISEAALAIQLVWSRVRAREQA